MNHYYTQSVVCLLIVASCLLASCVYEDEKQCPCEIRFVYDYNMEFADAFPQQVGDVKLFVFDSEGRFVTSCQTPEGRPGAGYRMPLSLPAGVYSLVAWAGVASDATCYRFKPVVLNPGTSVLQELQLGLNTDAAVTDRKFPDLWHGALADFEVSAYEPTLVTVPLVKNTNRFKILLQDINGQAMSKEEYTFSITDNNYWFDCTNNPLPMPQLTYHPYLVQEALVENNTPEADNDLSVLVAEMNTLRLMADGNPRFIIRNERTRQIIFDINLTEYLDLMRLSSYADMPLQEFLDRENTWNIILVVGQASDGTQMMISMQINAWRLIFNETDL